MRSPKNKWFRRSVYLLFLLLAIGFIKTVAETYQAGKKLDDLRDDVAGLETENQGLKKEYAFRQTDDFVEQEARNKLKMVKQGDSVVVFDPVEATPTPFQQTEPTADTNVATPRQWENLFRKGFSGPVGW